MSRAFTRLLSLSLASLMAIGQPTFAFAPSRDWPVTASADPLHLRAQTFSTGEVLAPYDKYTLAIEHGRLTARLADAHHVFDDLDVVAFEQNPDAVIVVLRSGETIGIDRHLLTGVVFRAPVPVFKMTRVNIPERGSVEVVFVNEKPIRALYDDAEAPLAADRTRPWHAGHVAIVVKDGRTRVVADEIPYELMADEFAAQEYLLRYWTDQLHPYGRRRTERGGKHKFDWPTPVKARRDAHIDWPSALAIQKLSRDTLERLTGNAEYWTERVAHERDQFRVDGEIAVDIPASLAASRRTLTPRAMLTIAAATLGGTALVAAAAHYGLTPEITRSIHATFNHWLGLISPVLVDAKYRALMFKSAMWMSLVPPVVWMTALLVDKTYTKLGDNKMTLALGGMRAMGHLNEPFWRRIADLLRQPHIVRAASLGIWKPWRTVEPDSALGRLAGLEEPTRMGWLDSRHDNARVGRLIRTIETQQAERYSFARWLALTIVSEESQIDPATILLLQEVDSPAAERALEFTPRMHERQQALIAELTKELERREADFDVKTLDEDQVERELKLARAALAKLGDRTRQQKTLDFFRFRFDTARRVIRRGLYDFARPENTFWKTALPKQSLADQNASMFNSDYYPGMLITYLSGSRAMLDKVRDLVAQAGAWFSTNREAMFGIVDTGRWYAINMPAMLTAIYQRKGVEAYKGFDPRELELPKPNYRGPGFDRSVRWYVTDFVNASDGGYGEIVLDRMVLSTKMMQTTYLLTTASRVLLSGATVLSSSLNYTLHLLIGHPTVGLIFDAITPTNERMEKRIAGYVARTEGATGKIHRGLRMNEPETWIQGMKEALGLFDDREARATPDTREYVERVRQVMYDSPSADDARELLFKVMTEPPLPGKVPKWIKHVGNVTAVYIATRLALVLDVMSFRPGLDWGHVLGVAAVSAVGFYGILWNGLKAWRTHQTDKRHACEEQLLTPNVRDAIRAIRAADLRPAF